MRLEEDEALFIFDMGDEKQEWDCFMTLSRYREARGIARKLSGRNCNMGIREMERQQPTKR